MLEYDGLVIGSPTYNREITGQMKTFFDRLWHDLHEETFLGKYAVCVNTYNLISGHSIKTTRDLSLAMGYNIVGRVITSRLIKFNGLIKNDLKSLDKAYKMGIKLVNAIHQNKSYYVQGMIRKIFIKPLFKKIGKFLNFKLE